MKELVDVVTISNDEWKSVTMEYGESSDIVIFNWNWLRRNVDIGKKLKEIQTMLKNDYKHWKDTEIPRDEYNTYTSPSICWNAEHCKPELDTNDILIETQRHTYKTMGDHNTPTADKMYTIMLVSNFNYE